MSKMAKARRTLLIAPLLVLMSACGGGDDPVSMQPGEEGAVSTIEGEVFYRERMLLPPGSEVEVQLQDISRADALATVMSSVLITPEGGPPYPFSISYDPGLIDPRMRYALRATISQGDRLLFSTTEYIDPFSGNPVQILVRRVAEPVTKAPSAPEKVAETEPEQQDQAPASGSPAAGSPAAGTPAAWVLQTLNGEPAATGSGGVPADLLLDHDTRSVAGFAGCNRFSGSFSSKGSSQQGTPIKFGPLATTMRACAEGAELERQFLAMLDSVDAYRMHGGTLELLSGESVVASFTLR